MTYSTLSKELNVMSTYTPKVGLLSTPTAYDRAIASGGISEIICTTEDNAPRVHRGETVVVARNRNLQTRKVMVVSKDGRQWLGMSDDKPPIRGRRFPVVGIFDTRH